MGSLWMGGLVAIRDIPEGVMIARYSGKELALDTRVESEYLMVATHTRDLRRRVVVDGHPQYGGLAGYANYTPHRHANAYFVDAARDYKQQGRTGYSTYVLLIAKEKIAVFS